MCALRCENATQAGAPGVKRCVYGELEAPPPFKRELQLCTLVSAIIAVNTIVSRWVQSAAYYLLLNCVGRSQGRNSEIEQEGFLVEPQRHRAKVSFWDFGGE